MNLYLAIEGRDLTAEQLRILTPRLMSWEDDVWLLDVTPCLSYWRQRAGTKGVFGLFQDILKRFKPNPLRVCAAQNPWQAVLLMLLMRERNMHGFVHIGQNFGLSIYQQLSWNIWWQGWVSLKRHFSAVTAKTKQRKLEQEMRGAERAIERMRWANPYDCQHLSGESLKRRFGQTIAMVLMWTFGLHDEPQGLWPMIDDEFPFIPYASPESATKDRHLDFPLCDWQPIEELLREDFDALCKHPAYAAQDLVTSLEWSLTLHDLSYLTVPIVFRYPHDLRADAPLHPVALLQANLNFLSVRSQLEKKYEELGQLPPPIIGWKLEIKGALPTMHQMFDLFEGATAQELSELNRLENLVAVPLVKYDLTEDWCPEASFIARSEVEPRPVEQPSLEALGRSRPPFIYHQPIPLPTSPLSSLKRFLERTMDKWWRSHANKQRDYYLMIDGEEQKWVFQDSQGRWFKHGLFA